MDKAYWNRMGRAYDDEIFDVRANDRNGTVGRAVDALANRKEAAFDFGCGTGKFSGFLATRFRKVDALDISESCLNEAGTACGEHSNIVFQQADLSAAKTAITAVRDSTSETLEASIAAAARAIGVLAREEEAAP